ncbi:MAG: CRTAC1 family protein [Acidobacteriota bacterium]
MPPTSPLHSGRDDHRVFPSPTLCAHLVGFLALSLLVTPCLLADDTPTFTDLALDPGSGLEYARTPSASSATLDALKAQGTIPFNALFGAPLKSRGAPGVALLDFDGDDDLDLYVTNGPGTANSLFANQLADTGVLRFVDVGLARGADVTDQDSTGVCFGDIDNDGDPDLYVLGNAEPNRLLENHDGTFVDITAEAGVGGGALTSTSCSFGDVDGDGLLDLVVANSWSWLTPLGLFQPFTFDEPNLLFVNRGAGVFEDRSAASGIQDNAGFPPPFLGAPAITWAISIVDLDLDGDGDVLMADDQGSVPQAAQGGVDRGFFHYFENNGTGQFTDVTVEKGLNVPGGWMGFDFGDLDCDGRLDFFASNFSDLTSLVQSGGSAPLGVFPSRWVLATDGGYSAPDLGELVTTPFGWGTGVFDYDGDGDLDVVYHGGMDLIFFVDAANAGVVLRNDECSARFTRDTAALAGGRDHRRRNVQGVAVGDLDGNGFDDVVSVSSFDAPTPTPLLPVPNNPAPEFDDARFIPTFEPGPGPDEFTFSGIAFDDGSLAVELNGGTSNRTLRVELTGAAGLATGARAPRDGIGAVVQVTPRGPSAPAPTLRPVVGGSSYASQHSTALTFGLGDARRATVDVLWPGGVRNRTYRARAGRVTRLVEIPCSYDTTELTLPEYARCVRDALQELVAAGAIERRERGRRFVDAIRAYLDAH